MEKKKIYNIVGTIIAGIALVVFFGTIGFAIFEYSAEKGWLGDRLLMWQINKQPTPAEIRKHKSTYGDRYEEPSFDEYHNMP